MIDIDNLFIHPEQYIEFEHKFLPNNLYNKFCKKILFRNKLSKEKPYAITPPNGLMIYGPPYNGKTILAKQFAQLTKLPYCIIDRYNIIGYKSNHTNEQFSELIYNAKKHAPCVVILENIESIFPHRKKNSDYAKYLEVSSNLSLLSNCGKCGVLIFATTTHPEDVDPQIGMNGYLNELFYTPFPDKEQRQFIVSSIMKKMPCTNSIDFEKIVNDTEDFTIGDIVALIEEIYLNAAYTNKQIDNDVIQMTLTSFKEPLSTLKRKKYDEINSLLEAKNKRNNNKTIGFLKN